MNDLSNITLLLIQDERRVLKKLKFPLIMDFIRTYKDEVNIYFLTEYINGMELFDVIREIGMVLFFLLLSKKDYSQNQKLNSILEA